ncbi:MAG: DUF2480 family protein [Bacteroidetes bacterium]|nr:DUF2480 family protein [Bacteroidota bacterium]
MDSSDTIINRVAGSALVSIDLEDLYHPGKRVLYDLKDNLFEGIVLKEKDFRDFILNHDWTQYSEKNIAITCSVDAIIPTWAYMLLVTKMEPYANMIVLGNLQDLENALFKEALDKLDIEAYRNRKVVIKGCSDKPVPEYAYVELTRKLRPLVASIMFGEPCSTVPVYKKPKDR